MAPTFTVLIPTRHRLPFLRQAVRSVLDQTYGDFELVISDNSDPVAVTPGAGIARRDGARDWVMGLDDDRVRYVAPGEVLNAPDHWEFALGHARGTWITVLPDDDGLAPTTLQRIAAVAGTSPARAVAWRECTYSHTIVPEPTLGDDELNRLVVEPFTGRRHTVTAREELHALFGRREIGPAPGLVSSAVHRDAVERMRRTAGQVFQGPDPFIRAAVTYLALEPEYVVVDLPLTVRGLTGASISLSFARNARDDHEVVREFDTEDLLGMVPTRSRTSTNLIAESLLRSKVSLPFHLAGVEHDLVRYFVAAWHELTDHRRADDGGVAAAEWRAALRRQRPGLRLAVVTTLWSEGASRRAGAALRRNLGAIPGARRLRKTVRARVEGRSELLVLPGSVYEFDGLARAAAVLEAFLPPPGPVTVTLPPAAPGATTVTRVAAP